MFKTGDGCRWVDTPKIGNDFKTIWVKTNIKLILPLQSHIHIKVSEQLQAEAVLPSCPHPGYTIGILIRRTVLAL